MPKPEIPARILAKVRALCLALPDAYEERAWTDIRWMVKKRNFAHVVRIDDGWRVLRWAHRRSLRRRRLHARCVLAGHTARTAHEQDANTPSACAGTIQSPSAAAVPVRKNALPAAFMPSLRIQTLLTGACRTDTLRDSSRAPLMTLASVIVPGERLTGWAEGGQGRDVL